VEGTRYAYKVEAHYSGGIILSGVLDDITAKAPAGNPTRFQFTSVENLGISGMESQPAEPHVLSSSTIPADRFESRGAARLYLSKISNAADFNDSILLLLTRNAGGTKELLANKRPIFPSEEALAGLKPVYADIAVTPDVSTFYTANGIDLFGVLQSGVDSGSIVVSDVQAPPPPRRLTSIQRDGKTFLQAMYGGPEYLAGPDVKSFDLHTSPTLKRSIAEKFTLLNQGSSTFVTDADGNRIYVLQCKGLTKLAGLPVSGSIRLTHDSSGNLLPPSRRLSFDRYSLSLHTDNTVLVRINTGNPRIELPASGSLALEAAADDPGFWGNTVSNLPFAPPVGFRLTDAKNYNVPGTNLVISDAALTCRILHRRIITPDIGVDRITGRKNSNSNLLELYLDRPLHVAGLFNNGRINDPVSGLGILQQFSGSAITADQIIALNKNPALALHCTRIWVAANASASTTAVNAELKFYPFIQPLDLERGIADPGVNPQQGMMRLLFSNSAQPDLSQSRRGGEIFAWATYLRTGPGQTATASTTDTIPLSMELLSDIRHLGNGTYEALVHCPKKINKLTGNQKLRFFPLLEYDISSLTGAAIPANSGKLDTYLALRSRDAKGNAGRMSKALQLTQIRPAITAAGPMPRMCDTAEGSDNRAPLPDATNHAMVCLQWNNAGTGLRYEVSRASGSAIINQHRILWYQQLNGFNLEELVTGLPTSQATNMNISNISTMAAGTYRLRLPTNNLNRLVGGRLTQAGNIYQIVQASLATDNNTSCFVVVKCTTRNPVAPSATPISLDLDPPYHLIAADSAKLRQLADLNKTPTARQIITQAFALLHSTPLPAPAYTDRMPASGTDRFFYKVRLVDAAENRGPWSAAGGAVLQWDLRAPEEVNSFSAANLKNKCLLIWKAPENPEITHIEIKRRTNGSPLAILLGRFELSNTAVFPKPFFTNGKSLNIADSDVAFFRITTGGQTGSALMSFVKQRVVLRRQPNQANAAPELIEADNYDVDFVPVNNTSIRITGISFKENQPSFDRYSIEVNGVIAQHENGFLSFLDETATLTTAYTYEVRFIKTIGTLQIPAARFTSGDITLFNLSAPDISGITSGVNSNGKRQLNLPAVNRTGLQVRVYRESGNERNLITTRINDIAPGFKGWQPLPAASANQVSILVLDEGTSNQNTPITVQFMSDQNITSTPIQF
jgi:hypothetical protein